MTDGWHQWIPRDTHPEAYWVQIGLYRDATPERKAQIVVEASILGRQLTRLGIQMRHPEYTAEQVGAELRRLLFGTEGIPERRRTGEPARG